MSEPLRDSDPKEIGGYLLEGRLGAGGMGTVYLARTADGSRLAIKVLRPELADSPEIRRRLAREADALKRLAGGYTARVLDVNADAEHPYLVMEYVPGLTLDKHVARFGPVTGGLAWAVVDALVEAAAQFHAEGVTHRDLKPSNVIIGPDGVKVIDFGVSRLAELVSTTEAGAVTGTLTWSSPEQALGHVTGAPSDVFNLGMIVAFAYTARHPFGEGTPAALMYRIVHESPNVDGLPSRLRVIVENCLAKSAAERPTASEVLRRVRAISRSSSNQGTNSAPTSTENAIESTLLVNVEDVLDRRRTLPMTSFNPKDETTERLIQVDEALDLLARRRSESDGDLPDRAPALTWKNSTRATAFLVLLALALVVSIMRYTDGFTFNRSRNATDNAIVRERELETNKRMLASLLNGRFGAMWSGYVATDKQQKIRTCTVRKMFRGDGVLIFHEAILDPRPTDDELWVLHKDGSVLAGFYGKFNPGIFWENPEFARNPPAINTLKCRHIADYVG